MEGDTLSSNLVEISQALPEVDSNDAVAVMGWPGDPKLKSSMALFAVTKPECEVFRKVPDKFFHGERDRKTIEVLARQSEAKGKDKI